MCLFSLDAAAVVELVPEAVLLAWQRCAAVGLLGCPTNICPSGVQRHSHLSVGGHLFVRGVTCRVSLGGAGRAFITVQVMAACCLCSGRQSCKAISVAAA
jgi:hypothetical protein